MAGRQADAERFWVFDIQGDVNTWCQESYHEYPQGEETTDDREDDLAVDVKLARVVRGGSFDHHASSVRSAYRDYYLPSLRDVYVGLRVARSLPLGLPAEGKPQ